MLQWFFTGKMQNIFLLTYLCQRKKQKLFILIPQPIALTTHELLVYTSQGLDLVGEQQAQLSLDHWRLIYLYLFSHVPKGSVHRDVQLSGCT